MSLLKYETHLTDRGIHQVVDRFDLADAEGLRRAHRHVQPGRASEASESERRGGAMADADGKGRRQLRGPQAGIGRTIADGSGSPVADPTGPRRPVLSGRDAYAELARLRSTRGQGWWTTEPDVGRVAHGSTSRVDRPRLRVLGDGVVPQVVKFIGRRLMAQR